jgi:isochorismate synthase EntC
VEAPTDPTLMKVRNVQHLFTPVRARLRAGRTLIGLVGRLHPSPAVGGVPREPALAWIREHERLDRGWYAGPVGWIDARGEGEYAVAIRSALLHSAAEASPITYDHATLFAGCGIVADSNPESEYQESVLKLQPMLTALGGLP